MTMLFNLGAIRITDGAAAALGVDEAVVMVRRHLTGDWGEMDSHDRRVNREAVRDGNRVVSEYRAASGARVWVITEADRSATTLLLPEEY
jgi:hypothetical protein